MSDPLGQILGHTFRYWTELDERFRVAVPNGPDMLEEIVTLRGKLAFYESRIADMAAVMKRGRE